MITIETVGPTAPDQPPKRGVRVRGDPAPSSGHPEPVARAGHIFLRACRGEPTEYTPVWLMRQAGRYLPEYRAVRERLSLLDLVGLEFVGGEGPVIRHPVRAPADVDRLPAVDPLERVPFVFEAVRLARQALAGRVPLIGFAGGPFTVASYLIEGHASQDFLETKGLMHREPAAWHALMEKLAILTIAYLNGQIAAGADAVQLFDSWIGCLAPEDYRQGVLPHVRRVIAGLAPGVPVIHFGTGTAGLLELMREAGGTVIGLDWRVDLGQAWRRLGAGVGVQGNLDPALLLADPAGIRQGVRAVLQSAAGRPGHIFNLGHGVLPATPWTHAKAMVEMVHEESRR